jgi:HEAT repeat protein
MQLLQDPRPEHRAAAAEALGRLGARQAIPQIRSLLAETSGPPMLRMAAAGALLQLGDDSGVSTLEGWMSSPVPGMRAGAAKGLAPRADAGWAATVRALGDEADPTIRIEAAKLLSAVDPEGARVILDRLLADKDMAVRELAGSVTVALPTDLARLRGLLRVGTVTRVRAAERLLELTR